MQVCPYCGRKVRVRRGLFGRKGVFVAKADGLIYRYDCSWCKRFLGYWWERDDRNRR